MNAAVLKLLSKIQMALLGHFFSYCYQSLTSPWAGRNTESCCCSQYQWEFKHCSFHAGRLINIQPDENMSAECTSASSSPFPDWFLSGIFSHVCWTGWFPELPRCLSECVKMSAACRALWRAVLAIMKWKASVNVV